MSPRSAPQVAQNWGPRVTGEPQRAHAGPEPGADRRRPQCGQYGRLALIGSLQNGQGALAPPRAGARAGSERTCVPGTAAAAPPEAPAAAFFMAAAASLFRGLAPSIQNPAPGSCPRPPYSPVPPGGGAPPCPQ